LPPFTSQDLGTVGVHYTCLPPEPQRASPSSPSLFDVYYFPPPHNSRLFTWDALTWRVPSGEEEGTSFSTLLPHHGFTTAPTSSLSLPPEVIGFSLGSSPVPSGLPSVGLPRGFTPSQSSQWVRFPVLASCGSPSRLSD